MSEAQESGAYAGRRVRDPADDGASDAPASGRGALIALAIAAVGTVAFAFGLRAALVKLPPERAARAGLAGPDTTPPPRFAPPARSQPDEYPRLR